MVTSYLIRKGGYGFLVTGIPCVFMLLITLWAVALNERAFCQGGQWLLAAVNGCVFALAVWMVVESLLAILKGYRSAHPRPAAAPMQTDSGSGT